MLSQCRNCGGPLDVRGATAPIKCRYCGVLNEPQQMPVIAPQTPPGWSPPRTWTPPPQFPAPSNVTLRYQRQATGAGLVIGILAPLVATIGIGAAVAVGALRSTGSRSSSSMPSVSRSGFPSSSITALTMGESEATIRSRFPGYTTFSDRTVLKLADGPFEDVMLQWDAEDPNHIAEFQCSPRSGGNVNTVCANLKQMLPAHWNGDSYSFAGARIYCGGSTLNAEGERKIRFSPNQHWRSQTKALWKAVMQAAYGTVKLTPAEGRTWLGTGYPLTELGKIDMNADVDRATAAVQAVFPGAAPSKHIGLNFEIGLDHPWFGEAELEWANEKGAKLRGADIRPRGSAGGHFDQQEAIVGCVERAFGVKPKVSVADHLANKKYYFFDIKNDSVRVYDHMVAIEGNRRNAVSRDTWIKALAALDACGRGR